MFFDSLGHGFKDLIILLFIIFTLVLNGKEKNKNLRKRNIRSI